MKITKLELFKVPPRWLFLKVETDEGITGWGEPIVEGKADTVAAAVMEMSEHIIGTDPMRIEDLFQVLYRGGFYRGGPVLTSAISGIEQALWDIKGKFYNAPIYDLLGGACRDRTRVYCWIGGDRPSDVGQAAKQQVAAGFTAVKMNATEEMHYIDSLSKVDAAIARIAAVREAVGKDIGIGIDFHGRIHKSMAKILVKELEPYRPMFIEEPVLPENNEALREIARYTSCPIATGERMYTRWGFKDLLAQGYVDIIQPDLSHAGGILETRKIAAMAEAYDVAVAPHCPLGPIALAACLQLDTCSPNAFIQEQSLGIHYNQGSDLLDYLKDPTVFQYEAGFVRNLTAPGLGIEINEDKVREMAAIGHNWKNPVWRQEDGTVAEW
ncbi:galactonate dehydratase [Paenibacillus sp. GCM10023248]|uniref:galactonate dehydratase n=1 Tax=Bacillales TaxID=1385 RepID=UPI002379BFD9|nr:MULTISPECIES: galactonate dehydratase [Bacillales]MDD9270652.1 galactonate dehydratase [Paenibacillus sp. MAHUQ-63]MDR6884677.1 galactonate dehydratase [Bacillus sp. 3255]